MLNVVDQSVEHLNELQTALEKSGLYQDLKWLPSFLKKEGLTIRNIAKSGGWVPLLANMVPERFPTFEDLVNAIKEETA